MADGRLPSSCARRLGMVVSERTRHEVRASRTSDSGGFVTFLETGWRPLLREITIAVVIDYQCPGCGVPCAVGISEHAGRPCPLCAARAT